MPTPPRHFKDELQDWLDQRLDAATCDEVERHLETCEECRREYEAMAWTKQLTTRRSVPATAPAELRARIQQSLRAVRPVPDAETMRPSFWRVRLRPIMAAAAVLVLVLGALLAVYLLKPVGLPEIAARDFKAYAARELVLELATRDVKVLEAHFVSKGVPFNTRVFDLGMMDYQLVGGRVQRPGPRARALFVYNGPAAQKLVCEMYSGTTGDLPAGATVRENKGVRFFTYQRDGLTAVFWQEGAVVCVLVSDIAQEQVVQLAFAKAMP